MKKKLIGIGLLSFLALSTPAFAHSHSHHHHGGPRHAMHHIKPHHHGHYHRGHWGVSFSTGALARRSCWGHYGYDFCPIVSPCYRAIYTCPTYYGPNMTIRFGF